MSFLGGGSDYPTFVEEYGSGAVLAASLTASSYVTVNSFPSPLFSHRIRASYSQVEDVQSVSEIRHPLIRAALRYFGIEGGIEIHNFADFPSFTGLGTSSAFAVALTQGLAMYQGLSLTPDEIARIAIYLERELLGEAGGFQDQVISAYGGISLVEFRSGHQFAVSNLRLSLERIRELEDSLILVFTGKTRPSVVFAERTAVQGSAQKEIVKRMRDLAYEGASLLSSDRPVTGLGKLLDEGWVLKQSLIGGDECGELERLHSKAMQAGALGGKLLGAGGGGFFLFVVPPEQRRVLMEAVSGSYCVDVRFSERGVQQLDLAAAWSSQATNRIVSGFHPGGCTEAL